MPALVLDQNSRKHYLACTVLDHTYGMNELVQTNGGVRNNMFIKSQEAKSENSVKMQCSLIRLSAAHGYNLKT